MVGDVIFRIIFVVREAFLFRPGVVVKIIEQDFEPVIDSWPFQRPGSGMSPGVAGFEVCVPLK